jgi:hypothetical protein
MEKSETKYWKDIYLSIKNDRTKKDFYDEFNAEQLAFLSDCRFEELLK